MKSFSKFFIPVLAAGLFAACSDDNNDSPMLPEDGPAEGVNMTISLKLPTTVGGRATDAVGNPVGTETAKEFESNIKEVLLVLADPASNAFIASAVTTTMDVDATDKTKVTAKSTFNKSVLSNYISSLSSNPENAEVNVYAFCNPTKEFKDVMATRTRGDQATLWANEFTTLSADDLEYNKVFTAQAIPMANKAVTKLNLPAKSAIEAGTYAEKYYEMGNINVVRSIARFDYKNGGENNNNTYSIDIKTPAGTVEDALTIELTHMALVNLSKSYFLLHRVAPDNATTLYDGANGVTLAGDYDDTRIADVDWDWKAKATTGYTNNFFYSSTGAASSWNRIQISTLSEDDNNDSWNANNTNGDYKIWRYVTENTIPGTPQNQKTGVSTGVVFRGVLKANDKTPEAFKTTIEGKTEPIYVYKDGNMFASWEAVKDEAEKEGNENTAIKAAFDACKETTDATARDAKAVEQGFTIYRYDDDVNAYCTLYYYWNRHVDNNNAGVMGEKEFGVVRNNVYKLSVTEISGLGHTRKPGDDPDPVDPNDPDEKSDVKIKVSCIVDPWTVRVNNIKF